MEQNNGLFELIKSLSKSEKRYFRLYTSLQKGSKLYMDLFNTIEKQKVNDDKLLEQLFKNNKGKLAFNKNYLQKIIFRSLEAYHSANSADGTLQGLIMRCKILFNKSLYKQYFIAIKKAKQFALKYERFGYLLEILEMEKMFTKKQEVKSLSEDNLSAEASDAIAKLENNFEYSKIIRSLFFIYRSTGTSRIAGHDDLIKSIMANKLMSNVNMAKSQKAKMTYYRIREVINKMKADYEAVIESDECMINLINENPYPFEDFIVDFRQDAHLSIISSSIKSGQPEKAEKEIESIKKLYLSHTANKIDNELGIVYYELEILLRNNNIKELKDCSEQLEYLLIKYKDKIESDHELMIHFKLICSYILQEDFDKALAKANSLLMHPLIVTRIDIESYTRILILIIHYEMKNYTLLPYLIRATYRFLIRSEKLFKLESLVISFLRKLPGVKNEDDLHYLFITLHKEMTKLKQDNFEKNAFEYFNFVSWVEKSKKIAVYPIKSKN